MFDELIVRYKSLSLWRRLLICVVAGLLPAAYLYFDQATALEERRADAETQEKISARKLVDVDHKLKNLEQTESQLAFTTEQLKKAELRLPDAVAIDEILRHVGKTAKEASVTVVSFQPSQEVVRGEDYKYVELPIKMTVESREYSQLCSWLDTIAGLKAKLYVKSWNVKREAGRTEQDVVNGGLTPATTDNIDEVAKAEIEAKRPRENLRLKLSADLSVFRLASGSGGASTSAAALSESASPPVTDPAKPPAVPAGGESAARGGGG